MSDHEKQSWIGLVIILVTLAAYFALFTYRGKLDSTSLAVLAIAGFLGFRRTRRRSGEVVFDERDRQIQRHALLMSLRIFYICMILFSVAAGITNGWDASVPIWVVVQIFWAASLVTWAIKYIAVIVQYRRGAHA